MKRNSLLLRGLLSLLTLFPLLSLAACGVKNTAEPAIMRLFRAEGRVSVSDGDGADVSLRDDLDLFSGYGVRTRSESCAWFDLDDGNRIKMDQNSRISIEKEGKDLEIRLRSGSLFFNITEPPEDDGSMNIRTSSMLLDIPGACGWVEELDDLFRVYLLEGKIKCSADGDSVRVRAGEMAELTEDGEIAVSEFTIRDIPDFVRDELEDEDLAADTLDASGPDPEDASPDFPAEAPIAGYRINHTDLDTDAPLTCYFERPVFDEPTPGYAAVNAFFEELETTFFSRDTLADLVAQAGAPDAVNTPYDYYYDAEVTAQGRNYVSVHLSCFLYAGGARPAHFSERFVLSTVTGERLGIRDFIDGSDDEILNMIRTALTEFNTAGNGALFTTDLSRSLDDYDFCIRDGAVHLAFDPGDIAPVAVGMIDITLPAPLKLD